jgi:hypothetical protein
VQVHGWGGLVPVPPQLHALSADVGGHSTWQLCVFPHYGQKRFSRPKDIEISFPLERQIGWTGLGHV